MDRERLIRNPQWDAGDVCVVCGSPYTQRHHILFGNKRKAADMRGYIIPLCAEHHTGGNGIHRNRGMQLYWMQLAQEHYEHHFGTRRDFINEFGKSYL